MNIAMATTPDSHSLGENHAQAPTPIPIPWKYSMQPNFHKDEAGWLPLPKKMMVMKRLALVTMEESSPDLAHAKPF